MRTVINELDSARFDPLLVRAVAKNAATSLESLATKADGLVRCSPRVRMLFYVVYDRSCWTVRLCRCWVPWPPHNNC